MEDTIITRLYNKILNRDPDPDGLETYKTFLQKRKEWELAKVLTRSKEYDERIGRKKWIYVFMCVRNNGNDLPETLRMLERIRRNDETHEYAYFIFENDSSDNTVELCKDFISRNHGAFQSDVMNKKQWEDVKDLHRVLDMAIYRNTCKSLCQDVSTSEFCVLVDTKVTFREDIFEKFKNTLKDDTIAMVTPFGKVGKKNVYYDTYALEFKDNRRRQVRMNTGIIDVLSACGGIFMVRSPAVVSSQWEGIDKNKSEHNPFCYSVSDFGRVVIDTSIHVEWVK